MDNMSGDNSGNSKDINTVPTGLNIEDNKRKYSERNSPSATMDSQAPKAARSDETGNIDPFAPDAYIQAGCDPKEVKVAEILEARLSKLMTDGIESSVKSVLDDKTVEIENRIEQRVLSNVSKRLERGETRTTFAMAHIAKMKREVDYVKKVNTSQLDRLIAVELDIRSNNVFFKGVPQEKTERTQASTLKVIKDIITSIPNEQKRIAGVYKYDFGKIEIERCYRKGKFFRDAKYPRPIFVKFLRFDDKVAVIDRNNRQYLPDGCFITNDYPPEIQRANRALGPILTVAKDTIYGTTRIKLIQGKIVVDNVLKIDLKNLHDIPKEIDYMKLYFIESDESYAFFGVLHIFSNFHWGPFEVKGVTFFMSEQYITTELARFAKDDEAYTELMNLRIPT